MNRVWKRSTALWVISMMILPLSGCSSGGSGSMEVSANQLYYESLAANNYTAHEQAQPPGDLFAAVKHFDLVANEGTISLSSASTEGRYAIYRPASAAGRVTRMSFLGNALPGEGIPGFKPQDTLPPACQGLDGELLSACLEGADDLDIGTAPPSVHASHFDAGALSTLFGSGFADALVDKVIEAKLSHVDSLTQDQVAAQLTDYINDAPAHLSLDLNRHSIFDREGYALVGATMTDSSRGDLDGDGMLEPHSTLQIQISKKMNYTRSNHSEIDGVLLRYLGFVPKETYMINLQIFIHLRSLQDLRLTAATTQGETPMTIEEEQQELRRQWEAAWINKALDANILKKLVEHPGIIPWESTEYILSFQLAPQQAMEHLAPVLAAALEGGDANAYTLIEQHMNAQTALITGGSTSAPAMASAGSGARPKIFYQVSRPRTVVPLAAVSDPSYVMLDSAGRRVAIYDPGSGAIVLAQEESKFPVGAPSVQPAWTKGGACMGDRNHWAYWPSRARTGNFGRGINWILTECLLHNQVGDYKNIHWWQSAWKSAAQVAIKSGMWVVKNYLQVQYAAADVPAKKSDWAVYYFMEVLAPYMADFLSNDKGSGGRSFTIAGYGFTIPKVIPDFWRKTSTAPKNETFAQKVGHKTLSFLIDRASDGVGQSLDVTVTGWQDYSDDSHYGCFAFSY